MHLVKDWDSIENAHKSYIRSQKKKKLEQRVLTNHKLMNVYNITFSEGNMLGQQSGAISKPEGLAK